MSEPSKAAMEAGIKVKLEGALFDCAKMTLHINGVLIYEGTNHDYESGDASCVAGIGIALLRTGVAQELTVNGKVFKRMPRDEMRIWKLLPS